MKEPSMNSSGAYNITIVSYLSHTRAGLSRKEIVANSIIFVIAGFENSKMLLTFLCYNLAMHKDCQERLRKEIQDGIAAHDVSKIRGKKEKKS